MLAFLQVMTIAGLIGATYLVFHAYGPRKSGLLYTAAEKRNWDRLIQSSIGDWFTLTSILGTLTSLATVYVFFIGNTRLFGFWIIVTVVTIWIGSFITVRFTEKLSKLGNYSRRLQNNEQSTAVFPAIFWEPNQSGAKQVAAGVRYVTLISLVCILWLEFSVFSDISAFLIFPDSRVAGVLIFFFTSFSITYFTLRYGLRGFILADLIHSPILIVASLILLGGTIWTALRFPFDATDYNLLDALWFEFTHPRLSIEQCVAFFLATIFLNFFFVLGSQAHWLRLWAFGRRENTLQFRSLTSTSIVWFVLIVIGLFASSIVSGIDGPDTIVGGSYVVKQLLFYLGNLSPFFIIAFWIAGVAALFSTADTQIYSLLLVLSYDSNKGDLREELIGKIFPFVMAIVSGLVLSVLYYGVKIFNIPFEKLALLFLPFFLNTVPVIVQRIRGGAPTVWPIWLSVILYSLCGLAGLLDAENEFFFSVSAPLMPLLVTLIVLFIPSRNPDEGSRAIRN